MQLKKCFLCEVFCQRGIADHSNTNCKNASFVQQVQFRESIGVPSLRFEQDIVEPTRDRRCDALMPQSRYRGRGERRDWKC